MTHDVAIIGAGIVGLATAQALAESTSASIIVLEAEKGIAEHQTSHNSGVIHAGLYYKPGSLRAKNCVVGREAMYAFCQEHGIPHERCGKLVVATNEAEIPALDEIERRGRANGLDAIVRLAAEQLHDYEPHVAGVAGLWVPYTGIINYRRVAEKYAELFRAAGGEVRTTWRLTALHRDASEIVLSTTGGEVRTRNLIACCGLQADRVARLCGIDPLVRIIPFRGEYYELVPERTSLVRNLIYPVPDARLPFLGVHFTRMIDGGVEAGPNAVLALSRHGYNWSRISPADLLDVAAYPGAWRMFRRFWRTGIHEVHRSLSKRAFVRALQKLIPSLTEQDVVRAGAGVRAQAVGPDGKLVDDFHILEAEKQIHVLNAPSPAATASLSIGAHLAQLAKERFELEPKS
ncbi:MAG: L-2-hydroxyglutarate oxidase [Planctomycetota bacterium]|nr:MAG: L-2-hydroxyglutarate oxidase [Planctomycetota bacterium]